MHEISAMKDRRAQEGKDARVNRWSSQFHEVIDKRIAAPPIGVEEAARQIEASGGERLSHLTFQEGIGVVEDGIGQICGPARRRRNGVRRTAV
jgi:hypothetical protein